MENRAREKRARVESTGLKPLAASRRLSIKLVLAGVWLAFTLALASWWMVFGLNQLEEMRELTAVNAPDVKADAAFKRQHRMLLSEGVVLLVLLLGGGVAILYGIQVERKRARQVEEFFASFTHDLKTSLASLRVQTESLRDDLTEQGSASSRRLLDRIMGDAGRLETQLENALFLADTETSGLLIESVDIKNLVEAISHHWPKMAIEVSGANQRVLGDRRAMESVVRNLAQNASRHGQATKLSVEIEKKSDFVEVSFRDNGVGFKGDHKRLGIIFDRQSGTSGSGIGLYLVTKLVERMQGEVRLEKPINVDSSEGFQVTLRFLSADSNPERRV